MTTYLVCWGEEGRAASPVMTVPTYETGKEWAQWEVDTYAREHGLPPHQLDWTDYLSRGTGPGTAHSVATWDLERGTETYEVWAIGAVKMDEGGDDDGKADEVPGQDAP